METNKGACDPSFEARKGAHLPSERECAHPGMTAEYAELIHYAASMRRKPFHTAVAAPEVSTGRMRASW
jgi:hypothetical protein